MREGERLLGAGHAAVALLAVRVVDENTASLLVLVADLLSFRVEGDVDGGGLGDNVLEQAI